VAIAFALSDAKQIQQHIPWGCCLESTGKYLDWVAAKGTVYSAACPSCHGWEGKEGSTKHLRFPIIQVWLSWGQILYTFRGSTLPWRKASSHWVLRGATLLCNTPWV
jgi:hypothetical protein